MYKYMYVDCLGVTLWANDWYCFYTPKTNKTCNYLTHFSLWPTYVSFTVVSLSDFWHVKSIFDLTQPEDPSLDSQYICPIVKNDSTRTCNVYSAVHLYWQDTRGLCSRLTVIFVQSCFAERNMEERWCEQSKKQCPCSVSILITFHTTSIHTTTLFGVPLLRKYIAYCFDWKNGLAGYK